MGEQSTPKRAQAPWISAFAGPGSHRAARVRRPDAEQVRHFGWLAPGPALPGTAPCHIVRNRGHLVDLLSQLLDLRLRRGDDAVLAPVHGHFALRRAVCRRGGGREEEEAGGRGQ